MAKITLPGTASGARGIVGNDGDDVGQSSGSSAHTGNASHAATLGQTQQATRSSTKRAASVAFAGLEALRDAPSLKRQRTLGSRRNSADAAMQEPGNEAGAGRASDSPGRADDVGADGARRRPIRSASLDDLKSRNKGDAPTLSSMIGADKARDLDVRFGSLQPVREKRAGKGIHAWERDAHGKPLTHANRVFIGHAHAAFPAHSDVAADRAALHDALDVTALKNGTKRYIWAVGRLGRVIIAEEKPLSQNDAGTQAGNGAAQSEPKYAGHPMLVGGGPARVSGELHYDATRDCLVVLDKSGRYSRYADRQNAQVDNVTAALRDAFAADGLDVVARKLTGKDPEPLKYPTLA